MSSIHTREASQAELSSSWSMMDRIRFRASVVRNAVEAVTTYPAPLRAVSRFHGPRVAVMEGFMRPQQFEWFAKLFKEHRIENIAETGFNGGHSAAAFGYLGATSVTSFDLGEHSYVPAAAAFIARSFPDTMFELRIGDSRRTVPTYRSAQEFDAAFIDGGHDHEVAAADIANMRRLSPGGLVIVDDYDPRFPWGIGPTLAYDQAVNAGIIEPLGIEHGDNRTWVFGRYTD